jgi:hypothetical protein
MLYLDYIERWPAMQLIYGLFFPGVATTAMVAPEFSTEPVKGNIQHGNSSSAEHCISATVTMAKGVPAPM